jgi:hypothetical protein
MRRRRLADGANMDGRPSGRPSHYSDYGQVEAIIFTASTFSFGAFAAELADDGVELAACSTVPEISTLWPTCGVSFASSASNRYSLATAVLGGMLPAVPVVPVVLNDAFVSVNFASFSAAAPAVPLVPVGACVARWMQPLTVMVFGELL